MITMIKLVNIHHHVTIFFSLTFCVLFYFGKKIFFNSRSLQKAKVEFATYCETIYIAFKLY